MIKIGQKTGESYEELKILAVTQTYEKKKPLANTSVKNCWGVT